MIFYKSYSPKLGIWQTATKVFTDVFSTISLVYGKASCTTPDCYSDLRFTREKPPTVLQAFARLVKLNQYTIAQAIRETTEPIAAIYRSFVLKSGRETYELVLNRSVYIVTKGSAFHFNANRKDLL